jgi:glycosyltransferase involved in cell wall biosynthesis
MSKVDQSVSIVVPCYNEEENLPFLYGSLKRVIGHFKSYEILLIDDGSTDNTLNIIKDLSDVDPHIKYISLSRNFGQQSALKAGLDHSKGDCTITLDADLQHPVDIIKDMIAKWQEGFHVVYTIRTVNHGSIYLKKWASRLFYRVLNFSSDFKVEKGTADFRLLDRRIVDLVSGLPESGIFLRGLIPWLGFKQAYIYYSAPDRKLGITKYSFVKMYNLASVGITSFGIGPLRIALLIGVFFATSAFLYGFYSLYIYLFTNKAIEGWTSIIATNLFLSGIQLMTLGVVGEYVGKLFIEGKRRPQYIIEHSKLT